MTTLSQSEQHGAGCPCGLCALPAIDPPTAAELATLAAEAPAGMPVFTESMSSVPIFSSNPQATAFLHLDFDGNFTPVWGSYTNVSTPPYDTNGDPSVYTQSELNAIYEIWARVAEDFAPFNIDVTTEDRGNYSNRVGLKVAIGGSYNDWYGAPAGGVGYVGSYTSGIANVVYVFVDGTGGGVAKYVAEASSHEAGHGFGLQHQSTYDASGNKTAEYNPGSGNWGPIMGVSYNRVLSTWHNGPNSLGPNNLQDDMAVLASANNAFGYRTDDHGGSTATATPLTITGGSVSGSGLIHTPSDLDYFSFSTTGGTVQITATGAPYGTNIDLIAQLFDENGVQVAIAQPTNTFNAPLTASVAAGNYFFAVKSIGSYGRVGEYTLSGSVSQQHPTGGIDTIDPSLAAVSGWASDADDLAAALTVRFRIDGVLQGGSVSAGQSHPTQGQHGFSWAIPAVFKDGQTHTLELVALDGQGGDAVTVASRPFVLYPGLLPGDANGDGQVTGADYTIWADNFGLFNGDATVAQGDFNGDGYVTGADYTQWSDNFGAVAAPPAPAPRDAFPELAAVDQVLGAWERPAWQETSHRAWAEHDSFAATLESPLANSLRGRRELRRREAAAPSAVSLGRFA